MCSDQVPKLRSVATISAELPHGWEFKESYTLLAPGRHRNVIFSSEPVAEDMDSGRYSQEQGVILESEFTGFRQIRALEGFHVDGLPQGGWLREFSWRPAGQGEVHQVQVYAVHSGRGYIATATSTVGTASAYETELIHVLTTLVVDTEAAGRFHAPRPVTDASEIEL